MSHVHMTTQERFPRSALIAAGLLILFAIVFAAAGRYGGIGTVQMPESVPVAKAQLNFTDEADGSVTVWHADGSGIVMVVEPETNGFLRGVMRGMARERMLQSVGPEPAFELIRWANGTLSLEDPETGRKVPLDAFGPDNAGAFAAILDAAEAPR